MPRPVFLLALCLSACAPISATPPTDMPLITDMTVDDMVSAIRAGTLTSEEIVNAYLDRIENIDDAGPMIQAVLSVNPDALEDARQSDEAAKNGNLRGPLHGIPVLVKDNIETHELPTTAGSLALRENFTERDATIIARLRDNGAIILGKTNLSEWANYRSNRSISGWSAVGGLTRNPHDLSRGACGSSSGSAAAVAASLAPLALGTETNGSITCPASMNGVVGFKPTVGLLPRTHIIPLSPRQDSAGPIARTVKEAAMMLTVMAGTDAQDEASLEADTHRIDYMSALQDGVDGLRIGVFRWAEGGNPHVSESFNQALAVMESQGAVLVDIDSFAPDPVMYQHADTILQTEFKRALNSYLAENPASLPVRSLTDLIAFNETHADRELALFDQSIFLRADEAVGPDDPTYQDLVKNIQSAARENGLDALLREHDVDVLVMPSAKPATPVDISFSSRPAGGHLGAGWLSAMAGYPVLSVPMGDHMGLPLGLMIMGTAWDDATVLRVGHHYQINSGVDLKPRFADSLADLLDDPSLMRPVEHSSQER